MDQTASFLRKLTAAFSAVFLGLTVFDAVSPYAVDRGWYYLMSIVLGGNFGIQTGIQLIRRSSQEKERDGG